MEALNMPGHLIRRLNQLSTQVFASRMQAAGIEVTPVQFAALDAIRTTPGLDQAGIAAMIAYDRATIGGVIERLLQKGYIERAVSDRDRRARVITMTEAGQAAYAQILPIVRDLQSDILPGLSEDESRLLLSLMKKVVNA